MGRISFEILLEFISTLLVLQLALFRRKLSPSTSQDNGCLRENVYAANAVLEFSVSVLVSAFFVSAPRHASGSS